jgi:hypothetical protein|tara:strand:+ start:1320 stop:1475 length:156 start_codon:yes stop_codon:yes gene_type:complete
MKEKNYSIYLIIEEDDNYNLPQVVKQRKLDDYTELEEAERELELILNDQML